MSAVSALEKFRYSMINFLANPEAIYKDIEVDGYHFTATKQRSDSWLCNLIGVPVTPYVVLTFHDARTLGVQEEAYQIFYDLCKLRYKLCVVFQICAIVHYGWSEVKTDGLCYLYRLSDDVQERQK